MTRNDEVARARLALSAVALALLGACSDATTATRPGAPTSAALAAATVTAAPTVSWLAPLGSAAAQPGANDDAAPDLSLVVCEAQGTACTSAAPVAVFTRTSGPAGQLLRVDATLGAFAADFNLMSAAFTTRKTYHVQLRQGAQTLAVVDVDIVRGRWALTTPGAVAPLRSASTLPIRVRVPRTNLVITPASAAPHAIVRVQGLPGAYGASPVQIHIGALPTVLTRNRGDSSWSFIVPADAPTGATSVTFPSGAGIGGATGAIAVAPVTFLGGSPGATLQTLAADFARMRAALASAPTGLDPTNDARLLRQIVGLRALLGQIEAHINGLPVVDRNAVAAFYSANRAELTPIFDLVTAVANDVGTGEPAPSSRRATSPARGASGPFKEVPPPSVAPLSFPEPSRVSPAVASLMAEEQPALPRQYIERCERHVRSLRAVSELSSALDKINVYVQAAARIPIPHLRAAAMVFTAATIAMDVATGLLNMHPFLLQQYGLQLEFSPPKASAATDGAMHASLGLRAAGDIVGPVAGVGIAAILSQFDAIRKLLPPAATVIDESVGTVFLEKGLVEIKNLLSGVAATPLGYSNTRRVPIMLDGVGYKNRINGHLWSFTSPEFGPSISYRTTATYEGPDVEIRLMGTVTGTEPGCSAEGGIGSPAAGIDGFILAGKKDPPPPPPPPGPPPGTGSSSGDPHLLTLDGRAYDFQGVGDYVLSRATGASPDFEVQVRHKRVGQSVSAIDGVAFRVGPDVVNVFASLDYTRFDLVINGEIVTGSAALSRQLAGGGSVLVRDGETAVSWPDGSMVKVRVYSVSLFINPARRGLLEGLLGNYDGNPANDVRVRDGVVLNAALDGLYTDFRRSWRVVLGSAESLFRRGPDLWDATFPANMVTLASFDPAEVERARGICRAAGVVTPSVLDGCALDILMTGDNSYAAIAVRNDPNVLRVSVSPALGYMKTLESRQFSASVSSAANTAVTWTTTGGTIAVLSPNVMTYTAPGTAGTYTITARSVQDGTTVSTATVTVSALGPVGFVTTFTYVGAGLRSGCHVITLPVPPSTAIEATITSADGSVLQLASSPGCGTTVGAPAASVTIPIAAGAQGPFHFVSDGMEGRTGNILVTANVPGFLSTTRTLTVAPAMLGFVEYPRTVTTSTGVVDHPLRVGVGPQHVPNSGLAYFQTVRPGGTPLTVQVTSTRTFVSMLAEGGGASVASATAVIAPGQSSTPATGAGALSLRAIAAGQNFLEANPVGAPTVRPAEPVSAFVVSRTLAFNNNGVDVTLEQGTFDRGHFAFQRLTEPATVTLTSANGAQLHVSFIADCEASEGPAGVSATLTLPAGSTGFCFKVYGRAAGTVQLTATAPGFSSATKFVFVRPAAAFKANGATGAAASRRD